MPAMTMLNENGAPQHYSNLGIHHGCVIGLTKREMFTMNAPSCPEWFVLKFKSNNADKLLYNPSTGCTDKLTIAGREQCYFAWRCYYADMALSELDK